LQSKSNACSSPDSVPTSPMRIHQRLQLRTWNEQCGPQHDGPLLGDEQCFYMLRRLPADVRLRWLDVAPRRRKPVLVEGPSERDIDTRQRSHIRIRQLKSNTAAASRMQFLPRWEQRRTQHDGQLHDYLQRICMLRCLPADRRLCWLDLGPRQPVLA